MQIVSFSLHFVCYKVYRSYCTTCLMGEGTRRTSIINLTQYNSVRMHAHTHAHLINEYSYLQNRIIDASDIFI